MYWLKAQNFQFFHFYGRIRKTKKTKIVIRSVRLHKGHHYYWRLRSAQFVLLPAVITRCRKNDTLFRQQQPQRKYMTNDAWCERYATNNWIYERMTGKIFFPFLIKEHRRLQTATTEDIIISSQFFNKSSWSFCSHMIEFCKKKTTMEMRSMVRSYTTQDIVRFICATQILITAAKKRNNILSSRTMFYDNFHSRDRGIAPGNADAISPAPIPLHTTIYRSSFATDLWCFIVFVFICIALRPRLYAFATATTEMASGMKVEHRRKKKTEQPKNYDDTNVRVNAQWRVKPPSTRALVRETTKQRIY